MTPNTVKLTVGMKIFDGSFDYIYVITAFTKNGITLKSIGPISPFDQFTGVDESLIYECCTLLPSQLLAMEV